MSPTLFNEENPLRRSIQRVVNATVSAAAPSGTTTVYSGRVTLDFANTNEASAIVSGQAGISNGTRIVATIYADNDDVLAEDWNAVKVRSLVAANGFTVTARCGQGTFTGALKVDWRWV